MQRRAWQRMMPVCRYCSVPLSAIRSVFVPSTAPRTQNCVCAVACGQRGRATLAAASDAFCPVGAPGARFSADFLLAGNMGGNRLLQRAAHARQRDRQRRSKL